VTGNDTSGEKYGEVAPVSIPRSEPQIPDSRGRTRPQPSLGDRGAEVETRRSGARPPETAPGIRLEIALAAR